MSTTQLTDPIIRQDVTAQSLDEIRIKLSGNFLRIPASVATPAKELFQAVTQVAKNQGWIKPGVTTDDI